MGQNAHSVMVQESNCIDHGYFTTTGRGYYKLGNVWLHRKVLQDKLGRPLIKGELARHTCDNPRCINPLHLIVGTYKQNTQDMISRERNHIGEAHHMAKLSEAAVVYIRANYIPRCPTHGIRAMARKYGTSPTVIHRALHKLTWKGR